ncbi:MAG: FAD-dependent oxidoreductase [Bacteroidetes bacterium]|nr:FAD-dependent oxidoreductase [Bacteroidota bacterium]
MEQIIKTDIFIAGAGPAGIAAAVAASELGMSVCIAEKNSFPGGRATASAVGTVCGLYLRSQRSPQYVLHGFPKLFAERLMKISGKSPVLFSEGLWFLPSHPADFEKTARAFLSGNGITTLYETCVERVESSSKRITAVYCSRGNENMKIVPECVIDCSGEGIICTSVNHNFISDEEYQAAAIVFSLKNISDADEFQLSYLLLKKITLLIEESKVPEYYNLLGIIPHSLSNKSVQMKMGLPWKTGGEDLASVDVKARVLVSEICNFLKLSVPGFEHSEMEWIAGEVGVRTGIRARGKDTLTDEDVLSCKKRVDGICNGAWPVEYWRTGNKRVEMTFLPENDFYSIPAGCLESGEKENLFFAGKIISAGEKAIASARVIGTCLGTGYAAGVLASFKASAKERNIAIEYIKKKCLKRNE